MPEDTDPQSVDPTRGDGDRDGAAGADARGGEEKRAPRIAPRLPKAPQRMFETRSQAWKEVGLLRQINPRVVKRARMEALVLVPLFVAIVVLYDNRASLFGTHVAAVTE